ncbi:YgdI/YgdR family lipoprotein [Zooshikella sp. RANM57]|uniref:YgdI/YgdR family lipoprotein n=1 Tax=Zooshikella sp. RANM57 TaxID=3425863 RepID=UPI003D6F5BCB
MRQILLASCLIGLIAGCASPQVIKMKDGSSVTTPDEVEFNEETGFYEYEDVDGRLRTINKDEIVTIDNVHED